MLVLSGAIGVLQLIAGLGLRKFSNRGRILGSVIAGIGLIVIPVGTVIGAYILYLLLGAKGKVVFSPEYQEVIAQTPHIRYRTSKWVWILLILFLLFIVFLMFAQRTPTP
jgi:Ca2+/Na+ antiporter